MSELEDILNYLETTSLEPHDDYVSEFSYKDQKTLWKYIKELQQENQELKKRLEVKEAQQKEFIEWLESNLEALEMCDRELILTNNKKEIKAYKEVLSKYKEIIGVKDEKVNC